MVVMRKNGGRLKTKDCPAQQRQSVLGPALSPLQDEFISNCSHLADSGIVSFPLNQLTAQIETPINFILDIHSYCRPNNIEY